MDMSLTKIKTLDNLYYEIYDAARRGLSNQEIASSLSVSQSQLTRWCNENPELAKMLSEIRESGPVRYVEAALLKVALGYNVDEASITIEGDEVTKQQVSTKHIKPELGAIKYFLNNRGENWADKVEVSNKQNISIHFDPALKDV